MKERNRVRAKGITSKRMLEREAVQTFTRLYNQTADNRLRLLYQQEKPDAVLMDSRGHKLGLEITHLFYSQLEARQLFQQEYRSFVCIESFENLVQSLNQLVARKEVKSAGYSRQYPLALLIRNLSVNFGWKDFNQAWDKIREPSSAFSSIWFLTKDDPSLDQWYMKSLKSLQASREQDQAIMQDVRLRLTEQDRT